MDESWVLIESFMDYKSAAHFAAQTSRSLGIEIAIRPDQKKLAGFDPWSAYISEGQLPIWREDQRISKEILGGIPTTKPTPILDRRSPAYQAQLDEEFASSASDHAEEFRRDIESELWSDADAASRSDDDGWDHAEPDGPSRLSD